MKLSTFKLFKNTMFTDMQNTLHFNSNSERDNWFDTQFTNIYILLFVTHLSPCLCYNENVQLGLF